MIMSSVNTPLLKFEGPCIKDGYWTVPHMPYINHVVLVMFFVVMVSRGNRIS